MTPLVDTPQWQLLAAHRDALAGSHLNDLFAADPQRFDRLSLHCGDLLCDFSKQRLTTETLALLVRLAEAREERPVLTRALSEAAVHGSFVRELTSVAGAATGRGWL